MIRLSFSQNSIYVKATLKRLFAQNKFIPTFLDKLEVGRVIDEAEFWLTLFEIHDKINEKGLNV